eukprot:g4917.t1
MKRLKKKISSTISSKKKSDWQMNGNKSDPLSANAEERIVISKMVEAVSKDKLLHAELEKLGDEKESFLLRFCRGFYGNQFKTEYPKDPKRRVEETILMTKRILTWRQQNHVSELTKRELPKRRDFNKLWVSGLLGTNPEGRPVELLHPFDPNLRTAMTSKESMWLHWQEKLLTEKFKAEEAKKRGHLILDNVLIVDFGDGKYAKIPSVGLSYRHHAAWFKNSVKWRPPDLRENEELIDIESNGFPDTLHKLYAVNTSWGIRSLWNVVKVFVYPTTRKKFTLLGSNKAENLKELEKGGISVDILPLYMGGKAPNPPGLLQIKKISSNRGENVQVDRVKLPKGAELIYRFQMKRLETATIVMNLLSDGGNKIVGILKPGTRVLTGNLDHLSGSKYWIEGSFVNEHADGFATVFVNTGGKSGTIYFEMTVKPVESVEHSRKAAEVAEKEPLKSPPRLRRKRPKGFRSPAVLKRSGYHKSVSMADMTDLPPLEGYLKKHTSWWNGIQSRYFEATNEYLNYYENEEDCHRKVAPLGSYNLKWLPETTSENPAVRRLEGSNIIELTLMDVRVEMSVDGDLGKPPETIVKQMIASNSTEADRWVKMLLERQAWLSEGDGVEDAEDIRIKTLKRRLAKKRCIEEKEEAKQKSEHDEAQRLDEIQRQQEEKRNNDDDGSVVKSNQTKMSLSILIGISSLVILLLAVGYVKFLK